MAIVEKEDSSAILNQCDYERVRGGGWGERDENKRAVSKRLEKYREFYCTSEFLISQQYNCHLG